MRVRSGDPDAARLLFERHQDSLRPIVRRRLANALRRRVGESDLIQETYCAVLAHLKEFVDAGPGSYRRWLEGILVHKVKDAVKWHGRLRRAPARETYDLGRDAPASGDGSASARAMRAEQAQALRAAIDRLGSDDRTVLRFVHGAGLSFVDIAGRTGRTPDAVRKAYGRALSRLVALRRGDAHGR